MSMMAKYGSKEWFEFMFESANQGYDKWGHQWRGSQKFRYKLYKKIIDSIPFLENGIIIDIGCGMGNFTDIIKKTYPDTSVLGMDISRYAIQYAAKKYSDITFFIGSLPSIPIQSNSCKFISCLECLNYLNEKERKESLEQIELILQHGGIFLFSGVLDDGSRYFEESKIIQDISLYFDIISLIFNYSKIYVTFEKRLLVVISYLDGLNSYINQDNTKEIAQCPIIFQKIISFIYSVPYGVHIINRLNFLLKKIIMAILSWEFPVKICYHMTRILLGEKGKTQIIILARKKKLRVNHV